MQCLICYNNIKTSIQCKYCSIIFCSLTCLEIHHLNYHTNNNTNLFSQNNSKINSPFLVKGSFNNNEIIYDSTYSLKYFLPVYDQNGKIKIIGSGAYGQVYLGLNTITKKYYAIKHMDKKNIYNLLHSLTGIQEEIEIQSRIDHPNIVKLLYVKETDISYDLIMEYAPRGNLFHFIRKNKGLNENKSFSLFIQVVNAINFLHENDLIHRDIKPENILIFDNNIVKLCDFGWCVKLNGQQRGTFCGTTEYMSPELVNRSGYGKEIDVWSLGVLLYEMIHAYSPFKPTKPNFDEKDIMENIINHNLIFRKEVSEECKKLIYGLLDPNINYRYKVEDIYNTEFVKKYEIIQYGFRENNPQSFNQNHKSFQNKINNIIYTPQIEMNNNINIHMSMDMKNYIYNIQNIQLPEKQITSYNTINNDQRIRNQSFPKDKKGIYSNYINSTGDCGNSHNNNFNHNYLFNQNINKDGDIPTNKSSMNNPVRIDCILNNNSPQQKKLTTNKTLVNFYPINLGKNREQELINIYSYYNNEIVQEDYKRDNKDFINFNNTILYLSGKRNPISNNLNQNENNKLINKSWQPNENNNQIFEVNNSQGINNLNFMKRENEIILDNSSFQNNNPKLESNINKSDIFNYSNNLNNISSINDYSNISIIPSVHTPLIKKGSLIQNNINFNASKANSFILNGIFDNNISMSSIQNNSTKPYNESINNNINLVSKSSILHSNNSKIEKINEFDLEDYKNIKESEEIKIEINSNNDLYNLNNKNKNVLSKSEIFYPSSHRNIFIKEKEPTDNFEGKKKLKEKEEKLKKIREKGINISVNLNYNKNNNHRLLNNKSEELINFKPKVTTRKIKNHNNYKIENIKIKKDKEFKITTTPLSKNIYFEQPKQLLLNTEETKRNSPFIKSKSFCDIEQIQKVKSKKPHNAKNSNKRKNLTSDKKDTKNIKLINKNFNEQNMNESKIGKFGNEIKNNKGHINNKNITNITSSLINVLYSKRENNKVSKINPQINKLNLKNINQSMLNKMSNQDLLSSSSHDIKKPKNNKKNHKKYNLIHKIPHNKMKLQKNNKIVDKDIFIGLTPNSKSYIKMNVLDKNKDIKKYHYNNIENSKSKNIVVKPLKINKISDDKNNSLRNRVDYNNKYFNNSNHNQLNSNLEKQRLLTSIPSIKINKEKEKIKINSINVNISNLKYNHKIKQKDISCDNTIKRKVNDRNNDLFFKQTESNLINNNSEFNDTNDERNRTPEKKSIFNKIKPYKILEEFQKELAESSKNEKFLKIKNS